MSWSVTGDDFLKFPADHPINRNGFRRSARADGIQISCGDFFVRTGDSVGYPVTEQLLHPRIESPKDQSVHGGHLVVDTPWLVDHPSPLI